MQDYIPIGNIWTHKDSSVVENADIDTFVITKGNRTQAALDILWCSVCCDCGLCVD